MLLKSTILEKRSEYPGMIQLGSKTMVAGSLSLTIFPSHAMAEGRIRWEGSSKTWMPVMRCEHGSRCWVKATVHMIKQWSSWSSAKVQRVLGDAYEVMSARELYCTCITIRLGLGRSKYSLARMLGDSEAASTTNAALSIFTVTDLSGSAWRTLHMRSAMS